MSTSCPDTTVEDLRTALQPFPEPSFLSETVNHDSSGNMSPAQFNALIEKEIQANRLQRQNTFSIYSLGSRVNREYCYYLKRLVFFDKQYIITGEGLMRERAATAKQKMDDLLAALVYLESALQNTAQVTPTETQRPLSYQNTQPQIEGMKDSTDVALRKDMLSFTEEKNRAANSLLALYGFLNLTAIGLLIYIYRSK
jgi:hypothetical protein